MRKIIRFIGLTLFIISGALTSFGQTGDIELQLDSLKCLQGDPLECTSITWRIISTKKDAIQHLIDKLDDSASTEATDNCKKSNIRTIKISDFLLI